MDDCRQCAKPFNFGMPGGMGVLKLVLNQRGQATTTTGPDGREYRGVRFCVLVGGERTCGARMVHEWRGRACPPTCAACLDVGTKLKAAWFAGYPENREYFHYITSIVEGPRQLTHPFSLRVRGGLDESQFCAAANVLFQARAAEGLKLAGSRVCREQYVDRSSVLFGSRTVLFLHDQLLGEAREDVAPEVAERVAEVMRQAMREVCPDVPVEAEPLLMRRWDKRAKTRRDAAGRLQAWS